MDDYLNFMVAKDPNAIAFNVFSPRKKRSLTPLNVSHEKKFCVDSHFGEIFNSLERDFEQSLQNIKRVHDEKMQKIDKLQRNVANVRKELMTVKQENAKLIDEKKNLETKLADMQKVQCKEKQSYEDKVAALKTAQCNAKNTLEAKIATLEQNKIKKTCAHCQADLSALAYCNDSCAR